MNRTDDGETDEPRETSWKKTALVCALIVAAAAAIAALTFLSEPTAKRSGASVKTAMLVDVTEVKRGDHRPEIVATGVVQPSTDIVLRPLVGGEVIVRAPGFAPGGFVEKGETLLAIEPADYRNVVQQRAAALRQARADLEIEMGRQDVARKDYELVGKELGTGNEGLVLRKPQLETAKGAVESARAALEQARLDLRRTTIKAPLSAHVISRDVDVGSQVAVTDRLGRLVGIDTYWVEISVPLSKLRWLRLPEGDEPGSAVEIRNRSAWPEGATREGELFKLIGALDERTRLARVLVTIDDPMARAADTEGPALIVGEFVEARIRGNEIAGAIRLDRALLRDNDTVWVMRDGKLEIREVEIAVRDAEHAFVTSGLEDGDRVVTTNLSTVTEGAALRLREGSG